MQQSDSSSYYQSHFQNPNPNPNPNPNDPPHLNPSFPSSTFASAPPFSSNYSPSDSSTYSNPPTYPPYPQFTDYSPNPPNPNSPQPYNFPHLNPQPTPFYGYDHNQHALNYDHLSPNFSVSSISDSSASKYGNLYENASNYGVYGDVDEQRQEIGSGIGHGGYGNGVYQYNGGKVVPYGGRGSDSVSSSGVIFDDYGRPIGFDNGKEEKNRSGISGKVVKAIPKTETQEEDVGSGVQKFRVKLLSEGAGQSDMDVLCQIGLDGIRILDVATTRTLRIYPLETVTRCELLDSYIFAFWAKSSIDIEPRRIRLKSNSYTTNNILDTVTAATFQIKEIGRRNKPSDTPKGTEQPSERKKGFTDWMNLMKPGNEEKDHWIPDEAVTKCTGCATGFGAFVRRHHCRNCGDIFCDKCTQGRIALTADEQALPVRVCDRCMAEVTQRLTNVKETAGNVALQSHEDLAKKLKEEMEMNRKTSTGMTSNGSGMRMKEVECPTCTVHLQVQVSAAGSETIECSVCQHPFLVSAH